MPGFTRPRIAVDLLSRERGTLYRHLVSIFLIRYWPGPFRRCLIIHQEGKLMPEGRDG